MLEELSVIEQGKTEIHHHFCAYSGGGVVVLEYSVARPEFSERKEIVAAIPFPAEKAKELGEMLIRYADEA